MISTPFTSREMDQSCPRPIRQGHGLKALRSALLPGICLLVLGCVTPVTIGDNHFGLGLYHDQLEILNDDVTYHRVTGLGLLAINGRLMLGFADHQGVEAQIDGRSYHIVTPLADIAVGEEAERRAMSPATFISHTHLLEDSK